MIEPLYHQVIAGNKTQTRRSGGLEIVNGAKATKKKPAIIANPDNWEITGSTGEENQLEEVDLCDFMETQRNIHCSPRYKIGEVLFLKEPTAKSLKNGLTPNSYFYKFGVPDGFVANYFGRQVGSNSDVKWSNKLFMPASAAREFIRVTGIKCERLLDISDEDCIAEGIEVISESLIDNSTHYKMYLHPEIGYTIKPQKSFIDLYRFANKMKPTADIGNPWVWAYTFEYLKDYRP